MSDDDNVFFGRFGRTSGSADKRTSGSVTRLPVSHRHAPHCARCGASLPTFNGLVLSLSPDDLDGHTLTGIILKITCRCGAKWNAEKIL